MCGFAGQIGGIFDSDRALAWLLRRGPDSQGLWRTSDRTVSLLHCRLAVVDQDRRSDQPFYDPAHGIVVALNGEIYNYRGLRQQYPDFPFRTESDTEVIVAAYIKEGIKGFNRLQGMFAFALIDERRQRVILVRDQVGKKPLFVFSTPVAILFGSSVLPLVASSGSSPSINVNAADFYWRRGYVSPDTSAVNGAKPVAPGRILQFDFDGTELGQEVLQPKPYRLYGGEPAGKVKDVIRELLERAIDDRLENNPNPVALLSGGIDSTVVTDVTARRLRRYRDNRSCKVITLGSMLPRTQDEYFARYAAARLGLDLVVVRPSRRRLPDAISRAISRQDEPLGMPSYFLLFQLMETVAPYGKVVLTGDGGDEVFLGYRPPKDWRDHELAPDDWSSAARVGPEAPPWMGSWARDAIGNTLLGHMFTKVDRASAEQGVEVRCPLLDLNLMAYVRGLPAEMLYGQESSKQLLKDQLATWPRWFIQRRKLGFAYNLRWHWGLLRFAGLRESVAQEAIETFGMRVPVALRSFPARWTTQAIFQNFGAAWRLMVWSAFIGRLNQAASGRQSARNPAFTVSRA